MPDTIMTYSTREDPSQPWEEQTRHYWDAKAQKWVKLLPTPQVITVTQKLNLG